MPDAFRFCLAPMMEWTDRHYRTFLRWLSPHVRLYTEMVHANALLLGDAPRFLAMNPNEPPVALQLGGSDPHALAAAARLGEQAGYAEINLNCGCPSDRVQAGAFGACLMHTPQQVAACVAAMRAAVRIPVTVKTRLGVDEHDSYDFLCQFIETVRDQGGCNVFILHARKAWLKGLSPKENRQIPPLDWDRVQRVKKEYPALTIVTNGGFNTVPDVMAQFPHVDGVMLGRKLYEDPWFAVAVEKELFGCEVGVTRRAVVEKILVYAAEQQAQNVPLRSIVRHYHGLFFAQKGAKAWKHALLEAAQKNTLEPIKVLVDRIAL